MSRQPNELSDDVTVLVFKDNHTARSFHVPLRWVTSMGLLLFVLALLTIGSVLLAIRFFRVTQTATPERVVNLEREISDLKNALVQAKENVTAPTAAGPAVVPTPSETSSASTPTLSGEKAILFSAFGPNVQINSESNKVPIVLNASKAFWSGKTLNVHFNILYQAEDKGNQQGRILVLARGPETLLAYPDGVLSRAGADTLLSPELGEYFSVSRFREVHARFGTLRSTDVIKDVEVLLFNESGSILIYERLTPYVSTQPVAKPRSTEAVNAGTADAVVTPQASPQPEGGQP